MPQWRNGRRNGLKIRRVAISVPVRVRPAAINLDRTWEYFGNKRVNSRTKKQHYVPESYLQLFFKNRETYIFDKFTGNIFSSPPNKIGHENYFYELPREYQDKLEQLFFTEQPLEKYFAIFEDNTAPVFKAILHRLATDTFSKIFSYEQTLLADYFVVQYIRTKSFRKLIMESIQKIHQELFERMPLPNGLLHSEFKLEFDTKYNPNFHLMSILDPQMNKLLVSTLLSHVWLIVENYTDEPFYTSDAPFARVPKKSISPLHSRLGFNSIGVEFFFPFSPNYGLWIVERNYLEEQQGKRWVKKYNRKKHPDKVQKENIIYLNQAQLFESHQYVYSYTADFEFAIKFRSDLPEFCSLNRGRLI